MAIYSEFSHEKWWFSIVMLVYQRVCLLHSQIPILHPSKKSATRGFTLLNFLRYPVTTTRKKRHVSADEKKNGTENLRNDGKTSWKPAISMDFWISFGVSLWPCWISLRISYIFHFNLLRGRPIWNFWPWLHGQDPQSHKLSFEDRRVWIKSIPWWPSSPE